MLTKYTLSITDEHISGQKEKNGDAFCVSTRPRGTKNTERRAMSSRCLELLAVIMYLP